VQVAPLSFLAGNLFGQQFVGLFTIIVFIPLIGTAASWIISSPRLLYAMSRSKALPGFFSNIHEKYQTPHNAIIFQTIVTILITIVALGQFQLLLSLLIPLVMILYSVVMLSVVKLRIDKPELKRYFSAPFARAGPILIVFFNAFILYTWLYEVGDALSIFALGLILIFFGIPLYILIRLQTDERFTERFFDSISMFWDKLFPIWYSRKDVSKVVSRLRLKNNSVVLDFGCGSGITTAAIAKQVRKGSVVAVDISEKQLEHAVNRVRKMDLNNVILIKEHQLRFRKKSFDALAAVGVLEYLDNPKKTMRKLISYLKPGCCFSMLSFGRSMGIPAPEHLKNEQDIRNIFAGLPVSLHISKNKKKLTEYWHVWGVKRSKIKATFLEVA
jgi:ubiquinone/menaquinone biosynthesis C-methylase UbiE